MKGWIKADQLINEYVKQFEQKYSGDSTYEKYVKNMGTINLEDITEKEVEELIKLI